MVARLTVFFRDEVLSIGAYNNVLLETWRVEGTVAHFRTMRKHMLSYARSHGNPRMALLAVVRIPSLSSLGADMRNEAAMRAKELRPYMAASALVLQSSWFAASLIRGALAGLALMEKSAAPSKVCESVEVATDWLAAQLEEARDAKNAAREIREAFEALARDTKHVGELVT